MVSGDLSPHLAWTRRDFLRLSAGGLVASNWLTSPEALTAAPEPPKSGVAVLDDCDPIYKDKNVYADNLSLFDGSGKLLARVTGLNACEEIGSPHRVAIDAAASRVWVAETVGKRLLQYDFAGKELLSIPDVPASALAIDPSTNHLWVARSAGRIGTGNIEVYDAKGNRLASYDVHGFDLIYDHKGEAFWLADRSLIKLSVDGKVLVDKPITQWCSVSLAGDAKTGNIWVATREHPEAGGKNALLGFDNDGRDLAAVELNRLSPFRVAVDSNDGSIWVVVWKQAVLLFSPDGALKAEHGIPALTVDLEPQTGNAWVVTQQEMLKMNRKGETLARAKHQGNTTQAWIASF